MWGWSPWQPRSLANWRWPLSKKQWPLRPLWGTGTAQQAEWGCHPGRLLTEQHWRRAPAPVNGEAIVMHCVGVMCLGPQTRGNMQCHVSSDCDDWWGGLVPFVHTHDDMHSMSCVNHDKTCFSAKKDWGYLRVSQFLRVSKAARGGLPMRILQCDFKPFCYAATLTLIVCVKDTATFPRLTFVKRLPSVCTPAKGEMFLACRQ